MVFFLSLFSRNFDDQIEFKFSQVCYFKAHVEIHQVRRLVYDNYLLVSMPLTAMLRFVFLAGTKIFSSEMVGNRTVFVPNHESLVLKCETRNFLHYPVTGAVSGEYRHKLFVKKGGEEIPVATSVVDGCETLVNHTVTKTSSTSVTVEVLFTLFRVKAEQAGSFTYGCMLVAEDAPNVNLLTQSSSSNNLNIVVCPGKFLL